MLRFGSHWPIKRSAHRSIKELEVVIPAYLDARDAALKPIRWTKAADNILSLITRFCHQPSTSNLGVWSRDEVTRV